MHETLYPMNDLHKHVPIDGLNGITIKLKYLASITIINKKKDYRNALI